MVYSRFSLSGLNDPFFGSGATETLSGISLMCPPEHPAARGQEQTAPRQQRGNVGGFPDAITLTFHLLIADLLVRPKLPPTDRVPQARR
jgi:hypothetical protein